jgi:hypothetical protein
MVELLKFFAHLVFERQRCGFALAVSTADWMGSVGLDRHRTVVAACDSPAVVSSRQSVVLFHRRRLLDADDARHSSCPSGLLCSAAHLRTVPRQLLTSFCLIDPTNTSVANQSPAALARRADDRNGVGVHS